MLLPQLRDETRALHDELEARLDLLNPRLSRGRYAAILRAFYGFYAPVERAVPAYGEDPSRWIDGDDRRKAGWLAADPSALDASADDVPRCGALPELATADAQLGCMYVLEGATLGGQHVLRHLAGRAAGGAATGGADWPRRFFASYGPNVGPMWRGFCRRLEERGVSPDGRRRMADAARQTFGRFHDWVRAAGL
jgi:heme oxygenase (biliverdin-IX-beta and delta-forming)